jgi:RHH-type rel operon transcriptional repressor/antitoxin RelB
VPPSCLAFEVAGAGGTPALFTHVYIDYNVYMSATLPLGRPISVRLPEELRERVEALAKATRRSQGDIVREVLERDLSELEWEQRVAARAADIRSGRVGTVPLSVLEDELGLTGLPVDAGILDEIE